MGPEFGEGWDGAVAAHVITRSVRDSAAVLDLTAGPEIGAPYRVLKDSSGYLAAVSQEPGALRIAFSKKPFIEANVSKEAIKGLEETARLLESLGHHVEEADPVMDRSTIWRDYTVVVSSYVAAVADMVKRELGRDSFNKLEPSTLAMAMIGRSLTGIDLVQARMGWHDIQLAMGRFLTNYDVFLTPALITPPDRHGTVMPTKLDEAAMKVISKAPVGRVLMKSGFVKLFSKKTLSKMAFTAVGNITGQPCMSVPICRTADNLPLGMLFTGRMCDEVTLFRLAGQLEKVKPWAQIKPEFF